MNTHNPSVRSSRISGQVSLDYMRSCFETKYFRQHTQWYWLLAKQKRINDLILWARMSPRVKEPVPKPDDLGPIPRTWGKKKEPTSPNCPLTSRFHGMHTHTCIHKHVHTGSKNHVLICVFFYELGCRVSEVMKESKEGYMGWREEKGEMNNKGCPASFILFSQRNKKLGGNHFSFFFF